MLRDTDRNEYISVVLYSSVSPQSLGEVINCCQRPLADLFGDVAVRMDVVRTITKVEVGGWRPVTHVRGRLSMPLDIGRSEVEKITDVHMYSRQGLSKERGMECHFFINYRSPQAFLQYPMGPCLSIGIRCASISDVAPDRVDAMCCRIFSDVSAIMRCSYGLVDLGDWMEIGFGTFYRSGWPIGINFQRMLERFLWTRIGTARSELARGVSWGNYLSAAMMKALGGATFLEQYAALDSGCDRDLVTSFADGSALVTLCKPVLTFMYPREGIWWPVLVRAAWLHERLAAAGLLVATAPLACKQKRDQ